MKIDIVISADYIRKEELQNKIVVVIDVFRATSVITTAIMNGCKEVIPLLTIEEAFELKNNNRDKKYVLGGERRAVKIDDFDYSNSPLEYSRENVFNKSVILTTTNGTRALTNCINGDRVLVGCMLNAGALAKKIVEINQDVVIVNAGTNGEFSLDDFICSGFIISETVDLIGKESIILSDISKSALISYKEHKDIISYVKEARHYNVMMNLGLENDIEYCIQKNITNVIPEFVFEGKHNRIIKVN